MPPLWKPQPKEVIQSWIDAILDEALDKLNSWETNFINDISMRVAQGRTLTELQEKKLETIYANYTK